MKLIEQVKLKYPNEDKTHIFNTCTKENYLGDLFFGIHFSEGSMQMFEKALGRLLNEMEDGETLPMNKNSDLDYVFITNGKIIKFSIEYDKDFHEQLYTLSAIVKVEVLK